MNIIIKILKRKKGITLIEIIIGSLLFALVAVTVTTVLTPMLMTFSIANDLAEYNLLLDNIGNQIAGDMSQASEINFTGDTLIINTSSGEIIYSTTDGLLVRSISGEPVNPVFAADFYKGKTVSFTVSGTSPNYTLHLTINPATGPGTTAAVITRDYAVQPLLLLS